MQIRHFSLAFFLAKTERAIDAGGVGAVYYAIRSNHIQKTLILKYSTLAIFPRTVRPEERATRASRRAF